MKFQKIILILSNYIYIVLFTLICNINLGCSKPEGKTGGDKGRKKGKSASQSIKETPVTQKIQSLEEAYNIPKEEIVKKFPDRFDDKGEVKPGEEENLSKDLENEINKENKELEQIALNNKDNKEIQAIFGDKEITIETINNFDKEKKLKLSKIKKEKKGPPKTEKEEAEKPKNPKQKEEDEKQQKQNERQNLYNECINLLNQLNNDKAKSALRAELSSPQSVLHKFINNNLEPNKLTDIKSDIDLNSIKNKLQEVINKLSQEEQLEQQQQEQQLKNTKYNNLRNLALNTFLYKTNKPEFILNLKKYEEKDENGKITYSKGGLIKFLTKDENPDIESNLTDDINSNDLNAFQNFINIINNKYSVPKGETIAEIYKNSTGKAYIIDSRFKNAITQKRIEELITNYNLDEDIDPEEENEETENGKILKELNIFLIASIKLFITNNDKSSYDLLLTKLENKPKLKSKIISKNQLEIKELFNNSFKFLIQKYKADFVSNKPKKNHFSYIKKKKDLGASVIEFKRILNNILKKQKLFTNYDKNFSNEIKSFKSDLFKKENLIIGSIINKLIYGTENKDPSKDEGLFKKSNGKVLSSKLLKEKTYERAEGLIPYFENIFSQINIEEPNSSLEEKTKFNNTINSLLGYLESIKHFSSKFTKEDTKYKKFINDKKNKKSIIIKKYLEEFIDLDFKSLSDKLKQTKPNVIYTLPTDIKSYYTRFDTFEKLNEKNIRIIGGMFSFENFIEFYERLFKIYRVDISKLLKV